MRTYIFYLNLHLNVCFKSELHQVLNKLSLFVSSTRLKRLKSSMIYFKFIEINLFISILYKKLNLFLTLIRLVIEFTKRSTTSWFESVIYYKNVYKKLVLIQYSFIITYRWICFHLFVTILVQFPNQIDYKLNRVHFKLIIADTYYWKELPSH